MNFMKVTQKTLIPGFFVHEHDQSVDKYENKYEKIF